MAAVENIYGLGKLYTYFLITLTDEVKQESYMFYIVSGSVHFYR